MAYLLKRSDAALPKMKCLALRLSFELLVKIIDKIEIIDITVSIAIIGVNGVIKSLK